MIRHAHQLVLVTLCTLLCAVPAGADSAARVKVGPGTWKPLYPAEGEEKIDVEPFLLDVRPVTNAEFLAFVSDHPKWRRDKVGSLFADDAYLEHWASASELGDDVLAEQPVTQVSWWAARAYCEAHGGRLPLEREWELAAMASERQADATKDPKFLATILGWYSQPGSAALRHAGAGPANIWGVRDLHGLVWEWVEDFQASMIVVDNRADGTVDTSLFCGAGAVSAPEKSDYAAFMRISFRSSLEANHAGRNLGFRCAQDLPKDTK